MNARDLFRTATLTLGLFACTAAGKDDTDTDVATDTDTQATDTDIVDTDVADTDVADTDVTDAPSCAAYCIHVTDACTGENQQYPSESACIALCEGTGIPAGTSADSTGDTLGCRDTHAELAYAGDAAAKTMHCAHAGLLGGGVCGTPNDVFCAIDLHVCSGANAVYADLAACTNAADGWAAGTPGAASGNSLACRTYHLGAAITLSAETHCAHTSADGGGVCVDTL